MSGGPGSSGGSNPRKFSEKIALHNQKQAEETRAFEQLMTDLTVSRVQFQKVQQLRLSQTRGQYIGGSLPNVNQICNTAAENQAGFPQMLDPRGTRHHGLVERVHRSRISSPHSHRRTTDKHRHCESSPYSPMYLSPPPDHNWRRDPSSPWTDDKRPGVRLMSQLNRTNSDSALHTSVMNPQEGFGLNQRLAPPLRNSSVNDAEVDGSGDIFSFPPLNEESMMGIKPLPKQLWEAKKVQSLASRPKSCEVPGISIFPSPDQPMPQPQYPPCLNSGLNSGPGLNPSGSLPDLTNLHFPSPLSTPLDSEEHYSHHHLPHAMMQMGLSSSLSNPSLCSSPRRRHTPISPLTLSPEQRRGAPPTISSVTQGLPLDPSSVPREPPPPYPLYQQSHTAPGPQQPPASGPNQGPHQGLHQQPVSPLNSTLTGPSLQGAHHQGAHQGGVSPLNSPQTLTAPGHQQQTPPPLQSPKNQPPPQTALAHQNLMDYSQNMSLFGSDPFMEAHFGQNKGLPYQFDGFSFLDGGGSGNCSFDPPSSSSSSLFYTPQLQHHNNMTQPTLHHNNMTQHTLHHNTINSIPNMAQPGVHSSHQGQSSRPPFLFPNAALPNIILTDDSGGFSLEEELRIEPLSLDGLSMLSDPDLVLPDPTVEDSFRSDRL